MQTFDDYCLTLMTAGQPTSGPVFDAACKATYDNFKTKYGATDGITGIGYAYVFQQAPSSSISIYPAYTNSPNVALAALHEAGHLFDFAGSTSSVPLSQSFVPSGSPPGTHAYYSDVGSDANYIGARWATDVQALPFYFNYIPSHFRELFAELFEMGISGHPSQQNFLSYGIDFYYIHGNGLPVPDGMACSETFVWRIMITGKFPTDADYSSLGSSRCMGSNQFPPVSG